MMWNLKGTLNEGFRTQLAKLAVATSIIMPTPEDVDHSVSGEFQSQQQCIMRLKMSSA